MSRVVWPGVLAAAIAAVDLVVYLALVPNDEVHGRRVVVVAAQIAGAAAAALAGSLAGRPAIRLALLTAAATMLFGWSLLGVFSIGMLLLPAAVLAWVGATQAGRPLGARALTAAGVTTALGAFGIVVLVVAVGP